MKSKLTLVGVIHASVIFVLLTAPRVVPAHDLLTARNGMTLYTFDKDVTGSGSSACSWQCIRVWPPALVGEEPGPGFGAITREGGARQLTYEGKPLYHYIGDHRPGDANGDRIDLEWHVVVRPSVHARR
jgi:predicted lipoprotein with Yx(FWY)xxD motif